MGLTSAKQSLKAGGRVAQTQFIGNDVLGTSRNYTMQITMQGVDIGSGFC